MSEIKAACYICDELPKDIAEKFLNHISVDIKESVEVNGNNYGTIN